MAGESGAGRGQFESMGKERRKGQIKEVKFPSGQSHSPPSPPPPPRPPPLWVSTSSSLIPPAGCASHSCQRSGNVLCRLLR